MSHEEHKGGLDVPVKASRDFPADTIPQEHTSSSLSTIKPLLKELRSDIKDIQSLRIEINSILAAADAEIQEIADHINNTLRLQHADLGALTRVRWQTTQDEQDEECVWVDEIDGEVKQWWVDYEACDQEEDCKDCGRSGSERVENDRVQTESRLEDLSGDKDTPMSMSERGRWRECGTS